MSHKEILRRRVQGQQRNVPESVMHVLPHSSSDLSMCVNGCESEYVYSITHRNPSTLNVINQGNIYEYGRISCVNVA